MAIYKQNTQTWYLERIIYLCAGTFVLTSILLGFKVSANFFYFTGLVGIMQIIFALTGFCPLAIILNKLGVKAKA